VSEPLVLTFPYSPQEHAEALASSSRGRAYRRVLKASGAIIGGGSILMAVPRAVKGEPPLGLLVETWPLIALGAFWFWVAPWFVRRATSSEFRRDSIDENRTIETRVFSSDGFRPSALWAQEVPWSEVREAVETSHFFLIEATSDEASYVPKHVLSNEQLADVRSMLAQHTRFRQRHRKILWRAT
jgi:hypothetical protein